MLSFLALSPRWPWFRWPGFRFWTQPGLTARLLRATAREPRRPAGTGTPGPQRPAQFDEQALIAAAQQGHLPSFNQLVLHYQSLIYNVAYRILGDPDSASDATQDGLLTAYRRLGQYRGGSFKGWLLRIVTNTCYDTLRAQRRRPTTSLEHEDEDPEHDSILVDTAERPDDLAMRQELAAAIQQAIELLPTDQRTVLVLSDVEGMDYQEIADITGAALGTVKSRLSRARARVRDILLTEKELLPSRYRLTDSP
jgi:RNA polymerase sigma factor (sigma-70 family)